MNDECIDLARAANKAEHARSRKLMRQTGMTLALALRATLTDSAGAAGLDALLAARASLRAAEAACKAGRAAQRAAQRSAQGARHVGPATAWRAWFDGSARPNPGHCGLGVLLHGPCGERIAVSQMAGLGDSADAEYQALIALLEAALTHGAHDLTIFGDSRVVLDDVGAAPGRAAPGLSAYRTRALALLAQLPGARLRWLPRHKNAEADALAQRASLLAGQLAGQLALKQAEEPAEALLACATGAPSAA